ncbi:MAG: hypothetical protein AAGF89_10805 [Bacteroidota bacterium]
MNCTAIGAGTCVKILKLIKNYFSIDHTIPCRSTVACWNKKMAHFQTVNISPSTGKRWALLMDESITIGGNKVLLLLGVFLDDFGFNRPLRFEDCHVLSVALARSWTGEDVAAKIDELVKRGFNFDYAVSDQGVNLIKAARLADLKRIDDCAHFFSTLLRRQYLQSADFESFEKSCTHLKRAGTNCKHAHLLPPKHFANSRFMNITPVINWGRKMIILIQKYGLHELIRPYIDKVNWVVEYTDLLEQMHHSVELVDQLSGALKDEGYHSATYEWAWHIIKASKEVPITIRQPLLDYFKSLESLRGEHTHLICSTDIVESHFAYLKRKPIHCVGAASKRMVLCHRQVNFNQVKQAMEACTVLSLYQQAKQKSEPVTVAQKRAIINKLIA